MTMAREKLPALFSIITGDLVVIIGIVFSFRYLPSELPMQLRVLATISILLVLPIIQFIGSTLAFSLAFMLMRAKENKLIYSFIFRDAFYEVYKIKNIENNIMLPVVWSFCVFSVATIAAVRAYPISSVWVVAVVALVSVLVADGTTLARLSIEERCCNNE